MTVVVTGAAGFIGFHLCRRLLGDGRPVVGIDRKGAGDGLAAARLAVLAGLPGWRFVASDITDLATCRHLLADGPVETVVHLAAEPGVRRSLEHPVATATANIVGQVAVFEAVRLAAARPRLVYASSSSVYGNEAPLPFSESQQRYAPASLYALTKQVDEAIADYYARAFGVGSIGLRFFTVYGPWGRPDMAPWLFAEAMLAGRSIRVFNQGRHERDFTYVDDIVDGVVAAMARAPASSHAVYNLGGGARVPLMAFVAALEQAMGEKARVDFAPMQAGDVERTEADIARARRDLGFAPKVPLEEGLARFVAWLRDYRAKAPA